MGMAEMTTEQTTDSKEPTWEEFSAAKFTADIAKSAVGKKLWYMRSYDIDKSGRGYYWPRTFHPVKYASRHLWAANGDCLYIHEVVRWTIIETTDSKKVAR